MSESTSGPITLPAAGGAREPDEADVFAGLDDDPDGDAEAERASGSALDRLRAEVARPIVAEPLHVAMRLRPTAKVRYDADLDSDELKNLRRRATNKRRTGPEAGQLDEFLFARLICASKNSGIYLDGEVVTDGQGRRLTFRSREFLDLMDATTVSSAVGAWYVGDEGGLQAHAAAVVEASGMSEGDADTGAADPTGLPPLD